MSAPVACAQAPRTMAALRRAAILQLARIAGVENPALDVDLLLSHATGHCRPHILAFGERELSADHQSAFHGLMQRRAQGEPIAYLLGHREFYGRRFQVTRNTLIPRPESELLVDVARDVLRHAPPRDILDLGTGSGCLALTFAQVFSESHVWATDCCPRARAVAAANAETLGVADRVTIIAHDFADPLPATVPERIEIIVSNPPYLSDSEYEAAPVDVRAYEPRTALSGGADGVQWYPTLIGHGLARLGAGGWLLLEIGASQGATVSSLFSTHDWADVWVRCDLAGRERVVCARRSA